MLTYRVFPPVFIKLLFGFTGECTFWTRVRSFSSMIHLMLFELPLCTEDLIKKEIVLFILMLSRKNQYDVKGKRKNLSDLLPFDTRCIAQDIQHCVS